MDVNCNLVTQSEFVRWGDIDIDPRTLSAQTPPTPRDVRPPLLLFLLLELEFADAVFDKGELAIKATQKACAFVGIHEPRIAGGQEMTYGRSLERHLM